jgi:hypothetical protein
MSSQTLIITGMHRSGTSLVASLLQTAGVDIGSRLMPPAAHNVRGYFEDTDLYHLSRQLLAACCPADLPGFHEIGWVDGGEIDLDKAEAFREAARQLIARRRDLGSAIWGWKDPRTVMLLDFWDELIPAARYLFVYRRGWVSAASFAESLPTIFQGHAHWPIAIWKQYNERLMAFFRKNRARCLLVCADAVVDNPEGFLHLVASRFALPLAETTSPVEPALFRSAEGSAVVDAFLDRLRPDVATLFEELQRMADLPGRPLPGLQDEKNSLAEVILDLRSTNQLLRGEIKEANWNAACQEEAHQALAGECRSLQDRLSTTEAACQTLAGEARSMQDRLKLVESAEEASRPFIEAYRTASAILRAIGGAKLYPLLSKLWRGFPQ